MISLTALRQHFPKIGLAHVSLILIGLMWVLPFLYFAHRNPITTFYQEWGAAMLGLGAMLLLLTKRYWQQPEIPRIILLPVGLILLVFVQFIFGKIDYFSQVLLVVLYLMWAALLVMLGQRLREELGLPVLATALAMFLLLGAELSALVGILQHFPWRTFLDGVVSVKNGPSMIGNMGQPNHFADYTSLGLLSLALLCASRKLRTWQVVLLAVPLLFVLVMSGSRSSWLYLLCMTGMAFLWQRRDKSTLLLWYCSLGLTLGFGLMHWAVAQIPWLAGDYGSVTAAQRMFEGVASLGRGSARLHVWHEAWRIFMQFPLLGAGFGQFGWQHFQLGPVWQDISINNGLYNNAHNLVMNVAAEMGVAGLLVLFGTLVFWFRQALGAQRTIYHWWGYGLLIVLGIHSALEYPLWYAYFLGVAALTLGILDNTTCRLELRGKPVFSGGARKGGVGRGLMVAILLFGIIFLLLTFQGYRKLEDLNYQIPPGYDKNDSYAQRVLFHRIRDGLVVLDKEGQALLLHPYIEYILGEIGWDHIADKGAMNERVLHFLPVSSVAYREALLLARAGRQAEARVQMERAIWSYPDAFSATRDKLRGLADVDTDPARFPALLDFALQKHEEQQRVVNAR